MVVKEGSEKLEILEDSKTKRLLHSHFITTTHITTPFAKNQDLKRAFIAEKY